VLLLLLTLVVQLVAGSGVVIMNAGGRRDNAEFRGELGVDNGVAPKTNK